MAIEFYDHRNFVLEDAPPLIDIERIYCLDWRAFTNEQWETLTRVFEELPEYQGKRQDFGDVPFWFGMNRREIPYLWAGIEPPGLQVVGELPLDKWEEWDRLFRVGVENLPFRKR